MKTWRNRPYRALIALGLSSSLTFSYGGSKDAASVEPPSLWDASFVAGLNLTDGNSDTLGINAGLSAERLSDIDEIYLGADFRYGEDDGNTTNESVSAFAQYNKMLNERAYLGVISEFLYDDIAAIDYRFTVGPTLGYYLIKNDRTRFAIEVGGGYRWEDVGGVKDDFFTLRFGQRMTHQLSDSMSLFESVSFSPEAEDFDNYTVDARAGVETRMTDRTSLQIYAQNRYNSRPGAGLEKNDFGVFSGISIALGAVDPLPAATSNAKGGAASACCGGGSPWETELGAGFSLTDGNSDTLSVNADFSATKITDANEIYLGAGMSYGETNSVRNTERAYAYGQYNKMVAERCYMGARTDFLYNDITALDYRVTPALLLGYYAIKNDTTQLALEAGPSFTWEDQGGVSDEYFGVYFGERFSHDVNDRVEIWQSAGVTLDVDNTNNVIINAAAGFDVEVNDKLTLRTSVQNIYDNAPPAGVESNDLSVTAGLVWTF